MTLSGRLAEWVAEVRYADLPPAVIAHARLAIEDTFLVAHAGATEPDVVAVHELLEEEGGAPASLAWAFGTRLPPAQSAFINSLSASALDYDSLNNGVHADVVSLPAAFAVAELKHRSGEELLTAFVVGSEIIARLRDAAVGPSRGWTFNGTLGVFGAAAAAAKLLGLDAAGIRNAIGIALAQAGGTQQANVEQVLLKRAQTALASRAGVFSALLAGRGIDGPAQALDGPFGFHGLYHAMDSASAVERLGADYRFLNTVFKKYPVCACSHPAIEAVRLLAQRSAIRVDEIQDIELIITPFMARLVGSDFAPTANPQVTAQFCLRYDIAAILLRHRLGLVDIAPAQVLDADAGALARRIRLTVDPAREGGYGPVSVTIQTARGLFRGESAAYLSEFPRDDHTIKRQDCYERLSAVQRRTLTRQLASLKSVDAWPDATLFDALPRHEALHTQTSLVGFLLGNP